MLTHPACTAIEAIDLTSVCTRLMHPEAGPGWDAERTRQAESDYREFLFVATQFPDPAPRPSADVDAFWHFHILDTIKYARDCQQAFGYFLHHGPDPLPAPVSDWRIRLAATRITVPVKPIAAHGTAANADSWCSAATPEAASAWCSAATPEVKAAWCSAAKPDSKTAWCSVAKPEMQTARCSVAKPEIQTAWCSVAKPEMQTAWCSAVRPEIEAAARIC